MVPNINLLPQMERRKSNSLLILLTGILVALVLFWLLFQYFSLKGDIEQLDQEEMYYLEDKAELAEYVALEDTDDSPGTDLASSVSFAESISYPVSPLLIEVEDLMEEHTYLRQYEFLEQEIRVVIDVETLSTASNLISSLLTSAYFDDVRIETINHFNSMDSTTSIDSFDIIPRYTATLILQVNTEFVKKGGETP